MLASRQMTLKPLFESKDGIHLTAYLVNRGDLIDLKSQIRVAIQEASEWLSSVMSEEERTKFLEPLGALLHDARIFKNIKGNIGLFKNETTFRVLNIPVGVEQSCQVATSFHIKPLLRWLQSDQEFLLLGLENEAAYLYLGSQTSLKLIDSIIFPEAFRKADIEGNYSSLKAARQKNAKKTETFTWLNDWILDLTKKTNPKLFIAGDPALVRLLRQSLTYKNTFATSVFDTFNHHRVSECSHIIRKLFKSESNRTLEKSLIEFRFADESNRTKKNIFQIARAVVQGKVRKLIVTDELNIFGKIDRKTGGVAIHPVDLDHEDDCILDDLAQMVLSQGGEVVIAKKNEIPKGRPILAILDDDSIFVEKTAELYELLEERFG